MDFTIASILGLDGVTSGAIYALVAIALVLVFAVTRIVFIPQGEYVAFGALTMALLQTGQVPGTVWLLLLMAGLAAAMDITQALRERWPAARLLRRLLQTCCCRWWRWRHRGAGPRQAAAAGAGPADAGPGHAHGTAGLPAGLPHRWPTAACWCC
jgi:hypothetical protein